ncbi:MAG: hypothetical protein H0W88_03840 [Parachlamydiaceae bacterium]|nr:hypothetical protein [Parachlamydiaceae bacterium]
MEIKIDAVNKAFDEVVKSFDKPKSGKSEGHKYIHIDGNEVTTVGNWGWGREGMGKLLFATNFEKITDFVDYILSDETIKQSEKTKLLNNYKIIFDKYKEKKGNQSTIDKAISMLKENEIFEQNIQLVSEATKQQAKEAEAEARPQQRLGDTDKSENQQQIEPDMGAKKQVLVTSEPQVKEPEDPYEKARPKLRGVALEQFKRIWSEGSTAENIEQNENILMQLLNPMRSFTDKEIILFFAEKNIDPKGNLFIKEGKPTVVGELLAVQKERMLSNLKKEWSRLSRELETDEIKQEKEQFLSDLLSNKFLTAEERSRFILNKPDINK